MLNTDEVIKLQGPELCQLANAKHSMEYTSFIKHFLIVFTLQKNRNNTMTPPALCQSNTNL